MGYVHDTHCSKFIPPTLFHVGAVGTWTQAAGAVAGTICQTVNDANQTSTVNIPIVIPSCSTPQTGSLLKSVEVDFTIRAGALTALTAVFNKITRGANLGVAVVAPLAFTYDTGHDIAAERIDVDEHKMTLTLDEPIWLLNTEYCLVELTIDQAGATDVIDLLGAVANYTYRV